MDDPDTDIRLAAFSRLRALTYRHGSAMPWAVLKDGFLARGRKFLFAPSTAILRSNFVARERPNADHGD
jgi:hypothetical protein